MYFTSEDLKTLLLGEFPFFKQVKISRTKNVDLPEHINIKILLKKTHPESYLISKKDLQKEIRYLIKSNVPNDVDVDISIHRWRIPKRRLRLFAA